MRILSQSDYREALKSLVADKKLTDPKFGFANLAKMARIQPPYLSKVLQGNAHLSNDQLHLICKEMHIKREEEEYLFLLLEHARTTIPARREMLQAKIDLISQKNSQSTAHLKAKAVKSDLALEMDSTRYYLDPLMQLVHVGISIDCFARSPHLLCRELNISDPQLAKVLDALQQMGFAKQVGASIVPLQCSLHLEKDSPVYRAWRNQCKMFAVQQLNRLHEELSYSFSVVFSADQKTKKQLHQKFLEFLKSCESLVTDAPPKQVFQMSFDLFPWTGNE